MYAMWSTSSPVSQMPFIIAVDNCCVVKQVVVFHRARKCVTVDSLVSPFTNNVQPSGQNLYDVVCHVAIY